MADGRPVYYRILLVVGPVDRMPAFGIRLARIVGLLKHAGEDVRVEVTREPAGESPFVDSHTRLRD
jgi:hypothetical protein